MRILFLTQYFPPEVGAPQNRLFELAQRLQRRGVEVIVLTGMPNYPQMRIHEAYRGRIFLKEQRGEITIYRSWLYASTNRSISSRLLNYFSFVFTSLLVGLLKVPRPSVVFCESPPLFLGMSGYLLARFARAKFIFNVSDLWPETAQRLGLITNPLLLGVATRLEEFLYRKADLVTGQTQGIVQDISRRFPAKRVYWLSNGVDERLCEESTEASDWRAQQGYSAEDFLVLYAGIIGHAQGLEVILEAARKLADNRAIKFLLVGDGPEKARLVEQTCRAGLRNVQFFDPVPKSAMPGILKAVNATVIPLRRLDLFKGAIPSKLFESLALRKPILLGVEGEARELFINQGQAGLFFRPEDADSLAQQALRLHGDPELAWRLGDNGRRFVLERFTLETIAMRFWNVLQSTIQD